ncbi:MAG: (2Fe-2S)-binding protein [Gammaproteobacteria bacterium]|nr:(2Fe-2S)-binding protein [Gammaproteobacteria bacterium]
MYVCVCNAVTESQIQEAVRQGATTLDQLRAFLRTSTVCGTCETYVEECLIRFREEAPAKPGLVPA